MKFVQARNAFFKEEGVNAMLTDSGKPDALLNMTGLGGRTYSISPLPAAFVTSENYSLIWRLLKRGPVEAEIEITNTISESPVDVYNTVAEIRGSEKPDEVVVLGAHLDSWDLGTGSTDNGTGSMVVLEAARAVEKLGLKPKRTIRFILFSGEEQGLNGSRAYIEAHKSELPKFSAALIHDIGTGKVLSIGMMENYQDAEIMYQVVKPLKAVGLLEPSEKLEGGSDHASFNQAGVPGFYGIQEPEQYFQTHHSQADTFDQVKEAGVVEGAQVLAVWAYNVAQVGGFVAAKTGGCRGDALTEDAPRRRRGRREVAEMRAVVQRVSRARVVVADKVTGEIAAGLVVLLAVGANDSAETVAPFAEKIVNLRIFNDDAGKMNRSLLDTGGAMLAISQFTLVWRCARRTTAEFYSGCAGGERARRCTRSLCARWSGWVCAWRLASFRRTCRWNS